MNSRGRLLLHVGLPKTGSSSLQAYLCANRRSLAAQGIHWSAAMRGGHSQLAACFADHLNHVARSVGVAGPADQERLRTRLASRLAAELRGGRDVLVSSEHLTAMLPTGAEVSSLADFCHQLTDRVEVVAVLRRGDYWLPSSYAEAVASGSERRFNATFVQFRASLLDHVALVERWTAAFGSDAVKLVPMLEQDKANVSALPARVLSALGVDPVVSAGWSVPPEVARPGLSAHAVEVLRSVTPLLPAPGLRPGRARERLRRHLAGRFPGEQLALTPSAAAELERRGWVHTGVDELPQAAGPEWARWSREPEAQSREFDAISSGEAAEVVRMLRRARVIRARRTPLGPALRIAAIRLVRSS